MIERCKLNYMLVAITVFGICIFLYLFFYLHAFSLNSLDSLFLMAGVAGSFLLYADFFWRQSWQRHALIGLVCIFSLIILNALFHFSFLFYSFLFAVLWLFGCMHFILKIITSTKEYANVTANHFLLYVCPPLFILIASYFLRIGGQMSPLVYDEYLMAMDGTLGFYPSLMMGQFIRALPPGIYITINILYLSLPFAFTAVYLRRQNLEKKTPYELIIEFILIGVLGFSLYSIIPGCGSRFAFALTWPNTLPPEFLHSSPKPISCPVQYPRNCLPSLHAAWIICLLRHAWSCDFITKLSISIFSFCTLIAMFGIGAHYLVDIVVGFAFANCFGGLFGLQISWAHPARWQALLFGIFLCVSWYLLILYGLPTLQSSLFLAWSVYIASILISIRLEWALFAAQRLLGPRQ